MARNVGPPIVLLAVLVSVMWGQADRGLVTGNVKDVSGAVIPEAQVTATQTATNTTFRTTTTTTGDYTIASLPVGTYNVRIEKVGFRPHVRDGLQVMPGGTTRVDATLQLGTAQETVEVKAEAQLLQVETARVQTQVGGKMVEDLPLVVGGGMRSAFDLAAITADASGGSGPADFRIGGGKSGEYGITLDGVSASTVRAGQDLEWTKINTPSIDALTDFSVESGGFKAEFGHASGGSIAFVSKSGTNEFHGTAYEFLRNDALDARGFFEAQKRVYKQHDFGATMGGPIWIPKIYDGRNKTFFFFSYEGFRNRLGATALPYSVAPPEFYTGDLRNWVDQNGKMIQIYDPATTRLEGGKWVRDPFPNNQIPPSRFDTFSQKMMALGAAVKPNVPGLVPGTSAYVRNNYISSGVNLTPFNKTSIKADHNLTPAQRVSFYFSRTTKKDSPGASGYPGLPSPLTQTGTSVYANGQSIQQGIRTSDVYRMSWDYAITPRLLNRLYGGINDWFEDHWSPGNQMYRDGNGWKDKICMTNVPFCDGNLHEYNFSDEFSQWGGDGPSGSINNVKSIADDMTFISGAHTFKWGWTYDNSVYIGTGWEYGAGRTDFNRLSTSIPLNTNQATGGGSAFAAMLLGEAYTGRIITPKYIGRAYRYHGAYFQDDWRLSAKFTLNLGVRWETQLPAVDIKDEMSDLDPLLPNPGADGYPGAIIFAGNGPGRTGKRTMNPGYWTGFGPRLGFSYSLNSKTVIRGSATRSFGAIRGGPRHAAGFNMTMTFSNLEQGLHRTFKPSEGMPYWPEPPALDPAISNGQTAAWYNGTNEASRAPDLLTYSFSVQRELARNLVVDAGYVAVLGNRIEGNPLDYNQINTSMLPAALNPFTAAGRTMLNSQITSAPAVAAGIQKPYPSYTGTVTQSLRPFPQFTGISPENRGGHSTYHSVLLKIEKRLSSGFTFQGSYLLSKTLTNADTTDLIDHFNQQLEKSIASYDQTHVVKANYIYELPFGRGKRFLSTGWASQVFGGWRISGIQSYASGTPLDLGTTISFPTGIGRSNRPTITTYEGWRGQISGEKFDPNKDTFFQPAAFFGVQPTDSFGNMTRRNPKLRGFPNYNENVSVAKSFNLKEKVRLDIRGEGFNLFNRTRFGPLSGGTTLQNYNFGLWRTQLNDPRRMQVAVKLYW